MPTPDELRAQAAALETQLTRADLKNMTPEQIEAARVAGRLIGLFKGWPDSSPDPVTAESETEPTPASAAEDWRFGYGLTFNH